MPLTASCVAIAPGRFGSAYAYGNGSGPFQRGTILYIVCSNPAFGQASTSGVPPFVPAQAHVLKSIDDGTTWVEVDEGNAPAVAVKINGSGFRGLTTPIAGCYQDADTLVVAYFAWDYVFGNPAELRFSTFDLITETWGLEITGGPASTTVVNMSIAKRASDGAIVFEYDGSEIVSAIAQKRAFFVIYDAGFGVEAPIDAAQTGSTTNYNIAGCVSGSASRTHLFYQRSTLPQVAGDVFLFQNTLTAGDALVGAVQITDAMADLVLAFAANRLVSGVTSILIGYIKTDLKLYFSLATSLNTPIFSEQLIGADNCSVPGVFSAGLVNTAGLVGSTATSTPELLVTGSEDLSTWETLLPIALPAEPVGDISITALRGLGVDLVSGDYPSAGVVVNAQSSSPA